MGYFPFFVDIRGMKGLIVGGGKVASHKVSKLLPFEPKLKIVAPQVLDSLLSIGMENDNIEICVREVRSEDVKKADFVIAASDDDSVNDEISRLCKEYKIPANVVDDIEKCDFIFPSIIQKGKLVVGISTSGASPEVASSVKNELAGIIPTDIDDILDYLAVVRKLAKENIEDDRLRRQFLKEIARECMDKNGVYSNEETIARIQDYLHNNAAKKGRVSLVGAGCGGYDLVTLKGIADIRKADVIVYDDLIDNRLLEFTSESCEKIYVGKRSGKHSFKQPEINQILVQKANEGKYVVRLKGGDPYVFGRATEEIGVLRENDIEYDYVPGITSAITAPGLAGIPVTSRNVSRSFHVITGHTSNTEDFLPENIGDIARLKGTLLFLMGLENLEKISTALIRNGKDKDTPAAVIHVNTDNSTNIIKSSLDLLPNEVKTNPVASPAIIIVGEVINI